jgi:hypothetical protein
MDSGAVQSTLVVREKSPLWSKNMDDSGDLERNGALLRQLMSRLY